MTNFDNLKRLIDTLKNISLLDRIFSWKRIRNLLIDAGGELPVTELQLQTQVKRLSILEQELQVLKNEHNGLLNRKQEIDKDSERWRNKAEQLQSEIDRLQQLNTAFQTKEETRVQEHRSSLASLEKIETRIQAERAAELQQRNDDELERLSNLKMTWQNHETAVKANIRTIAQRHAIDYIEKVPFKGSPDNTLFICEEYVVFDAKSPGGDDLRNFPQYLKDQTEKANKYARQPDVKPDIFFVVPVNTLESLRQFCYPFPEHTVYVISIDALEPLILNMKKIEEYEFAKELTPEDRNNICRILGRFAHLSKRRIQIDNFFARQFIELAYKAESSLPTDILESVIAFERTEKLNPPQEKRAKAIPTSDLERDMNQLQQDADGKGIRMEEENLSGRINDHPLYKQID